MSSIVLALPLLALTGSLSAQTSTLLDTQAVVFDKHSKAASHVRNRVLEGLDKQRLNKSDKVNLNPNQLRVKRSSENKKNKRLTKKLKPKHSIAFLQEVRSINGEANNVLNPTWGKANIPFHRLAKHAYTDDENSMVGGSLKSAREISNLCAAAPLLEDSARPNVSDMLWQWGQFLDHDLDLTPEIDPHEPEPIAVPQGDTWFDPGGTGEQTIPFDRSLYEMVGGVRQQINLITAYIDASNVYGSDAERAQELRANDGTGALKTSSNNLLPFNTAGLDNVPSSAPNFFLAGDFRANEQVGLASMHTLFVREHNTLAKKIRRVYPTFSGDEVYQFAKALVAAEIQAITYNEFLPVLLGKRAISRYKGYQANVDSSISNEFASAAYRFGHTMLSPQIMRLDANGQPLSTGHLSLSRAFFNPNELVNNGIEPILRGLAAQRAQRIDTKIVDDVRNLLFGQPGAGGLDLASLNIQRGRDHGLASYADTRAALGLSQKKRFRQITGSREGAIELKEAYGKVNKIDLWLGGLAETPYRQGLVGETFHTILVDQFTRLRDGDRFWYESYLPTPLVKWVDNQSLAKIIRRNTSIDKEIQNNVFRVKLHKRSYFN